MLGFSGANETIYDEWYESFYETVTDCYLIIEGFNSTVVIGDWLFQSLAFALIPLIQNQIIVPFSILTILGYMASTSLVNAS